jgi:hypothetical protein
VFRHIGCIRNEHLAFEIVRNNSLGYWSFKGILGGPSCGCSSWDMKSECSALGLECSRTQITSMFLRRFGFVYPETQVRSINNITCLHNSARGMAKAGQPACTYIYMIFSVIILRIHHKYCSFWRPRTGCASTNVYAHSNTKRREGIAIAAFRIEPSGTRGISSQKTNVNPMTRLRGLATVKQFIMTSLSIVEGHSTALRASQSKSARV